MKRSHIIQTVPLDRRLADEALSLRKEAKGTHHGIERERLISKARQFEAAVDMQEWLTSPVLRAQR